jgi:hypothetical protein
MNKQLIEAWHNHASLTRCDVFGTADPRPMPQSTAARLQVDIAAPGMIGEHYKLGGTVLLSINPSGGGDDYQPSRSDIELYDAFREFMLDGTQEQLVAMSDAFARQMAVWLVYKQHIGPILDALGTSRRDISYVYTVPFRVQGNSAAKIKKLVIENVWERSLANLLDQLAPSLIIAIDRASEGCALRHASDSTNCEVRYYTRKRDEHAARRKFLNDLKDRAPT